MNATPLIFDAQRSHDSQPLHSLAVPNDQTSQGSSKDFAGALNDAGRGPPRKSPAVAKRHDETSGGQLPQSGNSPPSTAPTATNAVAQSSLAPNPSAAPNPSTPGLHAAGTAAQASGSPASGTAGGTTIPNIPPSPAAPGVAAGNTTGAGNDIQLPSGLPGAEASVALVGPPPVSAAASPMAAIVSPEGSGGHGESNNGSADQSLPAQPTNFAQSTASATAETMLGAGTAPDTDDAMKVVIGVPVTQGSNAPQANSITDFMATDLGAMLARSAASVSGPAAAPGLAAGSGSISSGATLAAVSAVSAVSAASAASAASIAQLSPLGAAAGAEKRPRGGGSDFLLSGASNVTAAAQLVGPSTSAVSDPSSAATIKVSAGIDSAEFGRGIADGVSVMMDGNLSSAKLQINPPELGPIEVRIALQAGHAQVWFTSHSAVTRDALESSAPKLREMLGAQGFGQVSVDISQRSFQDRSLPPRGYQGRSVAIQDLTAAVDPNGAISRVASGLLDAYA